MVPTLAPTLPGTLRLLGLVHTFHKVLCQRDCELFQHLRSELVRHGLHRLHFDAVLWAIINTVVLILAATLRSTLALRELIYRSSILGSNHQYYVGRTAMH